MVALLLLAPVGMIAVVFLLERLERSLPSEQELAVHPETEPPPAGRAARRHGAD